MKKLTNGKHGKLTLIPTPISEKGELDQQSFNILFEAATTNRENSLFVVEDAKPGRQRWIHFKLPRDLVDSFILYNEHTKIEARDLLLKELLAGKDVFLMSDGGLPAFCDPGKELVYACHKNGIQVTSAPFCNSVILALTLSGFSHERFIFEGFISKDSSERLKTIKTIIQRRETTILMDTPYRLKRTLEEFKESWPAKTSKELFLALSLGESTEALLLGTPDQLLTKLVEFKQEFVLVVS
jgi:16S rRNA (cytidine1402-2'-O)-methyltransferase